MPISVTRLSIVAAAVVSSLASGREAAARLRIAATVPDLAAIAQAVAREHAEVITLSLPTQDPHFVDARPNLVLKLSNADLLLVVGLDLEVGWLPRLLVGSRNARIQSGADGYMDCSGVVQLKEVPRTKVDRSQGDIHPGGNPHYLIDPANAARVARAVAERLAKLDAAHAQSYQQAASRFVAELQGAETRWRGALAPYRGRSVVAYHKSWIYFTDAVGLRIAEHLEPKPGIPPSPTHLLKIIQLMRTQGVRVVLQEEYYPDRTARLLCEKVQGELVVLPGGPRVQQDESYIARMDAMVTKLLAALERAK